MRLDTARLQVQLHQMENLARDQDQRQANMEVTDSGLAEALPTALQQVKEQTINHRELLQRHQTCLEELNQRSQSFDSSQKALEMTAEALISQRERDTNQFQQEMNAPHHQTLNQEQELRNQNQRGQQGSWNEQQLRTEVCTMQQRLITLENATQTSGRNQPPPVSSNIGGHGMNPKTMHTGMLMAAPIVDGCPVFTHATYSQWKREVKLWMAAQCGATQTQLLSKLITVLPQPAKISGLTYMEATEITPEIRHIDTFLTTLDGRYGKTDSEKSRAWLNAFTEFTRSTGKNLKDFWARFFRVINRLDALNMKLSDQMVFNKALQALKLPEWQTPIVISALETRQNSNDAQALKEITIRMYETHKTNKDNSDVFTAMKCM